MSPTHPLTWSRLLLCLGLGFLTTIAIAWSLAAVPLDATVGRLTLHTHPLDSAAPGGISFIELHGVAAERFEWAPLVPLDPDTDFDQLRAMWERIREDHPSPPPGIDGERPFECYFLPQEWPAAAGFPRGRLSNPDRAAGRSTDFRGLPFPALSCSAAIFASPRTGQGSTVSWGIALRKPTGNMQDPWIALPLRPVFPGLLLDTLAWSFAWLVALVGFPVLRGMARAADGLCPRCAYSRTGLAPGSSCPECGHTPR